MEAGEAAVLRLRRPGGGHGLTSVVCVADIAPTSPGPGDRHPGFMAEPSRCWALVYNRQLQATHCRGETTWTGRWFSPRGDQWWRVWSCPDHLDGLTGLRQFGQRRQSRA